MIRAKVVYIIGLTATTLGADIRDAIIFWIQGSLDLARLKIAQ